MPSRIIRESARNSKTLAQLSAAAERMWWRLITVADDHGLFEADPELIASVCFPRFRGLPIVRVEGWLQELARSGGVVLYSASEKRYGVFVNWAKHQRPPRSAPKHPLPPVSIREQLPTDENNCGLVKESVSGVRSRESRVESKEKRGVTLGGEGFVIPDQLLTLWKEIYPAIDVRQVVRAAFAWTLANPANRKSNWHRFLVNWLNRAQDQAPRRTMQDSATGAGPAPSVSPVRPKQRAWLDEPEPTPEQRQASEIARTRAAELLAATVASLPRMPT